MYICMFVYIIHIIYLSSKNFSQCQLLFQLIGIAYYVYNICLCIYKCILIIIIYLLLSLYFCIVKAPLKPEKFEDVLADFEEKVMPGVVHWNHPKFFAYFPSGNSFPSILGDMLSAAIGSIGFSWVSLVYA